MPFVLQVQWKRDLTADPFFGKYVVDYDPTLETDGTYTMTMADDIEIARRFRTKELAEAYRDRPSPNGTETHSWMHWGRPKPIYPLTRNYIVAVLEV